jgi:flagella basal body P-ring formation protein FlgA
LAAESGLEERVRGVIKNYLVQKCPEWKEKRVVITFNQSDPTFKKIDNWGEIQKCEMVELSSSLRPAGVVALPIRFIDVAGRQQIALINTRVEIYDFAVVALKREKKGEALQISDLKLEERDVSLLGSRYFNDVLGMVGLIATTTIPQDSVIQPWMVKIPPLVTKGGRVSLLFCSPNVRVAVAGEVLDDAYLGQKVKVRRGSQKKTYEGTVVSSREVEVII